MTQTGVLTTRGFGPLAGPVARWAGRRGATPAAAARAALVLTAVAAVWFSAGTLGGSLTGSLFLAAVLFSDAVGARLWPSPRDALAVWTTTLLEHLRECVLYTGLAIGAGMAGNSDAWAWATAALVAQALRESVAWASRAKPAAPVANAETALRNAFRGGSGTEGPLSPIDVVDPSRDGRAPADPSFTAELLGGGPRGPDGAEGSGPIRIDTAPPTSGSGLRPLRRTGDGAGPGGSGRSGASRVPRPRRGRGGTGSAPAPRRGPRGAARLLGARRGRALGRALAASSQSERFTVIAVTVTIWDATVAFAVLCVAAAIAVAGMSVRSLQRAR